ncbi:NAD(P)H-dependent glycerol-3-phosphate dehydrogenase [uncultured Draconibacterium sp.]|uniref:NAD(P)H-dependent glycerol-3-phosphate dehydrogenase n=1 Tax=uncultured Draconibacterium sp. TaxID=1573823 RepID=UPI003217E668
MNIKTDTVGIIGSGSWATAIAKMLLENVNEINWYFRKESTIKQFKNTSYNPRYLREVEFETERINFYHDVTQLVEESDILIMVVPSAYLPGTLAEIKTDISGKYILSGIKGIVGDENLLVAQYLHKKFNVPYENLGVLAGPCHAEEVASEKLSYLTVAAINEQQSAKFAELIECDYIYTTLSDDIWGTEYAAVLKNIIAIASGIAHGLRYGDNFHAVLISRAIQEMKRFVDTVHPITRDIKSPAYLGDLLVTSYSQFSRNRTFGTMIGKGYSVKTAQLELNMVAEGYYASKSIQKINEKYKVDMPITDTVYKILYDKVSPGRAFTQLTKLLR